MLPRQREGATETKGNDLRTILENPPTELKKGESKNEKSIKSIINFNLLLIHTLRIFLAKNNPIEDISSIDEKKLLELFNKHIFKENDETILKDSCKKFLKILVETRIVLLKFSIYIL